MAPLIPRMHLFEIDDQTWFPAFLRAKIQAALTVAWTTHVPIIQSSSPAQIVARILSTQLKSTIRDYVFIDFCAGGGGPTPMIEKHLNSSLTSSSVPSTIQQNGHGHGNGNGSNHNPNSKEEAVRFVLTDLHPHPTSWSLASSQSQNLSFVPYPVDASSAPPSLVETYKGQGKKVFRLFNLAFHHFDDPLAKAILRNTLETSDGFGIFELQGRNFQSFVTMFLFGLGILIAAPYYAFVWASPLTLVFTYLVPVLPFVLVFDGWMSALRTRTAEEVEVLLRTCGVEGQDVEGSWEVRSGKEKFMWPVGELNWVVCVRKER
ncbi:hypothetical protein V8F33_002749 [Rhypophila sp. PSN 637]